MSDLTIELVGLKELDAKLGRLKVLQIVGPPMARSLARLQKSAQVYPKASGKPQPFKTEKQRRYFFWALRKGLIEVPYRRTNLLKNAWEIRQQNTGQSLIGIVGNNVPYAGYVQGGQGNRPPQASYHAGNWRTTDDIIARHKDSITRDFNAAIKAALES